MSMPNIPDINPNICIDTCDAIDLLFNSLALKEIALSQIIDIEEKLLCLSMNKFKNNELNCNELNKINSLINDVISNVNNINKSNYNKIDLLFNMSKEYNCNCKCNEYIIDNCLYRKNYNKIHNSFK